MDRPVKTYNIMAWAFLVMVEVIQLIVLIALVYSFIPIKLNDFVRILLPIYWEQVRPEREMFFYSLFIILSCLCQAFTFFAMRRQLQKEDLARKLLAFILVEAFWMLLQLVFVFKIFVFGNPPWAHIGLYGAIGGSILCKIFWPEVKNWARSLYGWINAEGSRPYKMYLVNFGVPLLIFILLWPVHFKNVLAEIFAFDNFYSLDFFVMSPGWAYHHGLPIDVEVSSNYNVFIPAFFGWLAKISGGFDYVHVLKAIIVSVLLYYVACYFFLRAWLSNELVAIFGIFLIIKLQLFHWGIFPLVWRYPSTTPARYLFDIAVIFLIWRHASRGSIRYLWAAAVGAGVMLVYVLDAGVYITAAFYGYILMQLLMPQTRGSLWQGPQHIRRLFCLLVLPLITGFLLLWLLQGPSIWQAQFWVNITEYSRLFLKDFGTLPVTDCLKDKQFFAFVMGFVIPIVYVGTIISIGTLCFLRRISTAHSFVVFLGFYGLGLYHYYVYRSAVNTYYAVCIPFVFILCFWFSKILAICSVPLRRVLAWGGCMLTVGALMTSYLFTVYPNCLRLNRVDYSQMVQLYEQNAIPAVDINLIQHLTTPDERVALISSFETEILIAAKRKPFFYYFPLIHSFFFTSPNFQGTDLLTTGRMDKTLKQLQDNKPVYIFVEKKLYGQLPAEYYQHYQTLTMLLRYVAAHYEPVEQGQFLLALKRKS